MNQPLEIPTDQQEPPHSVAAEQALLGSILFDNSVLDKTIEIVKAEDFAFPEHQFVFAECVALYNQNQKADIITLGHMFERVEGFKETDARSFFAHLGGQAMIVDALNHARLVRDCALRRDLIEIGTIMTSRAYGDNKSDAKKQIEEAEQGLSDLSSDNADAGESSRAAGIADTLKMLEGRFNDPGSLIGLSTGLEALDRRTMGLQDTDLIVLAGGTSMGKTALAQKIAYSVAEQFQLSDGAAGAPVGFFSLEMSKMQLNTRFVSERASIPLEALRSGNYEDRGVWGDVVQQTQAMGDLPLFIDDRGGATMAAIRGRAKSMKRQHNIGLFVVDQLSHILPPDVMMSRVHALGHITKGLKQLAKELEVPILLLHQLSRALQNRDDKRPLLSDLRDSGEVEQDADLVLFIHREQYYLERSEPSRRDNETDEQFSGRMGLWQAKLEAVQNTAEIIIAKQRMGPIGSCRVQFDGTFTRFGNLTEQTGDMFNG